jgi:hypothetical protein
MFDRSSAAQVVRLVHLLQATKPAVPLVSCAKGWLTGELKCRRLASLCITFSQSPIFNALSDASASLPRFNWLANPPRTIELD